jgi:hypothetical protein
MAITLPMRLFTFPLEMALHAFAASLVPSSQN